MTERKAVRVYYLTEKAKKMMPIVERFMKQLQELEEANACVYLVEHFGCKEWLNEKCPYYDKKTGECKNVTKIRRCSH